MSLSSLGCLPKWNLLDFYNGIDDPLITSDLAAFEAEAVRFIGNYEGKISSLDAASLKVAIRRFEEICESISKISSYADLCIAIDRSDPARICFEQGIRERLNDISSMILFFTLEINALDDETVENFLIAPELGKYQSWFRDLRSFRPYQLGDSLEKLLHDKQVTGRGAWTRLFDETMIALRVNVRGEAKTVTEALNLMTDCDAAIRKDAALGFSAALIGDIRIFALVTNMLAKDKAIEDRWRGYPTPIAARNLSNQVEDEVVEALVSAVRAAYPRLAHRYYSLKAQWFGGKTLAWWDRNAPLPDTDRQVISWEEACKVVMDAYAAFSPEMAALAAPFFTEGWIDAGSNPGKSAGAFAHPTVPSVHPYLLLNYQGKIRDVMTLAHELGHGVHQRLAGEAQGYLMASTPLTFAETASVFGEMLTFKAMLKQTDDPIRRRLLLAGKIEDTLNTIVRQIALHQFENSVHQERQSGELIPERLGTLWLAVQRESLGPAIIVDDAAAPFWAAIPHFVHTPFYVYAYAFGECLVTSLYAVYEEDGDQFVERYLKLLRAGGSQRHDELLAPFGLDIRDPGFWTRGLEVISGLIDELHVS